MYKKIGIFFTIVAKADEFISGGAASGPAGVPCCHPGDDAAVLPQVFFIR